MIVIELLGMRSAMKYGPHEAGVSTPFGLWSAASAGLIAWKNGIASRASRSGAASTSVIVSLSPSTTTPEIVFAFPSNTSSRADDVR